MTVQGVADVTIIIDKDEIVKGASPHGKAFLRVTFEDTKQVDLSLTLAELIGGIAKGTQLRLGYVKDEGRSEI